MSENINDTKKGTPLSQWERVKGVLINPKVAFRDIVQYPNALFPIALIVIGMTIVAFIALSKEVYIEQQVRIFEEMGQGQPTDGTMTASYYSTILLMPVGPLLIWAVKSFIVNGLGNHFGEDEGSFKETFSIIGYAYIPVFIGQAALSIIGRIANIENIVTNLAMFLPKGLEGEFIYHLLSHIDVFVIWYQILAIIGVSYVFKLSNKKASFIVLGSWLTWIMIASGIGAITTALVSGPL